MATVTPGTFLISHVDKKRWCKKISSLWDICLRGRFPLGGEWISWETQIPLEAGTFLLCAAAGGPSDRYLYTLIEGGEEPREIPDEEIEAVVTDPVLPAPHRARAQKTPLFRYALYLSVRLRVDRRTFLEERIEELQRELAILQEERSRL